MLITGRRRSLCLVWSFYPVPSAITMSSETPSIRQRALVRCSPAERDHHTGCGTSQTQCRRVIYSGWRLFFTAIKLVPTEWGTLNTETPDIVHGLLPSVTTEDQKIGFTENDRVTISATRGASYDRDNHPLSHCFTVPHIKQIEVI